MRIWRSRPLGPAIPRRDFDFERAADQSATPDDLEELSRHADPLVRLQVAMNPSTDNWTRERLDADDEVEAIRSGFGDGRQERAARAGTWPWYVPGDFDGLTRLG